MMDAGVNVLRILIKIDGNGGKKFPQGSKHPEIVNQQFFFAIEQCLRHAPSRSEGDAVRNPGRRENACIFNFAESSRFDQFHTEVEVFPRLPPRREAVGTDIAHRCKTEAGAYGVKGMG